MTNTEFEAAAREYRELQAGIRDLEGQAETLKQDMIRRMDEWQLEEMTAGEYTIRYSLYESARLDSTRLKAEQPGIYAAYMKRTVSTRFHVA